MNICSETRGEVGKIRGPWLGPWVEISKRGKVQLVPRAAVGPGDSLLGTGTLHPGLGARPLCYSPTPSPHICFGAGTAEQGVRNSTWWPWARPLPTATQGCPSYLPPARKRQLLGLGLRVMLCPGAALVFCRQARK